MRKIFFYGDSFTAGDELSDNTFFTWKSQCKSISEYHKKRSEEISKNTFSNSEYLENNKSKAYPKKIESTDYQTFNKAENGASLKAMLVKSLEDVFRDTIDFVVFQVPVSDREFYLIDETITSVSFNGQTYDSELNNYVRAKLLSHNDKQQSLEDIIDLILYDNFLNSLNIPHWIIFFNDFFESRQQKLKNSKYKSFLDFLQQSENILYFSELLEEYPRELAGHFSESTHKRVADLLTLAINEKLSNKSH